MEKSGKKRHSHWSRSTREVINYLLFNPFYRIKGATANGPRKEAPMVIKYRRPTSASRVGQDMRNTYASQPNCRLCPPDLPPRDGPTATTTENGEKAPPPLPPRGAVAKAPSRASPYAGLGK